MITLLKMSLSAAVLITLILLLRTAFLNRLPKRTFKLLWAVVIARMLLPVFLPIYPTLPAGAQQPSRITMGETTTHHAIMIQDADKTAVDSASGRRQIGSLRVLLFNKHLIMNIWAAGFLAALAFVSIRHKRSMLSCKTAPPCSIKLINDLAESFVLKRKILVKTSDEISSPMTYGIIHPTILIPENMQGLTREQLEFVLAHEIMHIKKLDLLYKRLLMAAVCVHWFNPLAWVMLAVANRDIELACDEAVLAGRDDIRREYAMTLIGLEERRIPMLSAGLGSGNVKERIVAIMKFRKITAAATAASAFIILGSLAVFAANDSSTDTYEDDKEIIKVATIDDEGNVDTVYDITGFDDDDAPTSYIISTALGVDANGDEVLIVSEDYRIWEEETDNGTVIVYKYEATEQNDEDMIYDIEIDDSVPTAVVPDVVGMSADEAARALEAEGFAPVRHDMYDDTVPAGIVVMVLPEPGTEWEEGSAITYFVSLGALVPHEAE